MTSPRTPRQWNAGDTIPDDVEQVRDVHGRVWTQQWLRMDDGQKQWRLPGTRFGSSTESVTRAFGPVSEVLPETPEPPLDGTDGSLMRAYEATREARGLPECCRRCWEPQRSCTCAGGFMTDNAGPVPASQSVPAVPVSSTGGKETGEAAETATRDLRADLAELINDSRDGADLYRWNFLDAADAILAAGWRPPVPDSETENALITSIIQDIEEEARLAKFDGDVALRGYARKLRARLSVMDVTS